MQPRGTDGRDHHQEDGVPGRPPGPGISQTGRYPVPGYPEGSDTSVAGDTQAQGNDKDALAALIRRDDGREAVHRHCLQSPLAHWVSSHNETVRSTEEGNGERNMIQITVKAAGDLHRDYEKGIVAAIMDGIRFLIGLSSVRVASEPFRPQGSAGRG